MSRASISLCIIIATAVAVMMLFFMPMPEAVIYQTATIGQGALDVTCMIEGTVTHTNERYMLAPVAGKVEQVMVKSGEKVGVGELVLQLNTDTEFQMLSALDTGLNAVEATFRQNDSIGTVLNDAMERLELKAGKAELMSALAAKQIRAEADGVIDNIFVEKGDYVATGSLIGSMHGEEACITAQWTGNHSRLPKAGMAAFWCDTNGSPEGLLVLEAVSLDEQQGGLRLRFQPVDSSQLHVAYGSSVPVLLILDTLPESGLMPLDAIGDDGRVWIVRNGKAVAERIVTGSLNGDMIQVPLELAGSRVLLEPESMPEEIAVRTEEGM